MSVRTILLVLALASVSVALPAAEDPFVGTWKLNPAKSKFDPGPPPKSLINKYEAFGDDGLKITTISEDAQGRSSTREYTEKYDGKDYPTPGGDTVSVKRVDTHIVEGNYKREGKIRATFRRVISKDGKTLTTTAQGKQAQGRGLEGRPYSDVRVFDKQ